ncbi:MAG: MFS transporter [Desulfobacteraceae bacterium]|nr:MFS transporter [Desulfobacteraceae bacterium]
MNRNLNLLLSGQLVSQIGDKLYLLALSLWVLEITGSPAAMGAVLFASMAPLVLFGFFSGAFVDRYNRKNIIIGTDIFRGFIIAAVAVAYYMGALNVGWVIVAEVLLSINAAFFNPAIPSVIPQIVTESNLTKANSKVQFIAGFSNIIGPVLGGAAVIAFDYGFVFVLNAATFLISAGFECFLNIPRLNPSGAATQKIGASVLAGYRYLLKEKRLLIIIFMVAVIHFFVGSIQVIMPVLASSLAGHGAGNLGLLQAVFGAGSVFMAFIISIHSIHKKEVIMLFTGVGVIGFSYLLLGILGIFGFRLVFPYLFPFVCLSCALVLAGTSFQTIIQQTTANEFSGRVFAIVSSVGNGSIPLAALIYGILLTYIDHAGLLFISGTILVPMSIGFYYVYGCLNRRTETDRRVEKFEG